MLKSVTIKSFKGVKETLEIKIDPLTLFSGANSSGKSTIIQAILFVKQNIESNNLSVTFDGKYFDFYDFKHTVFGEDLDNEMELGFEFFIKKKHLDKSYNTAFETILKRLLPKEEFDLSNDETTFEYNFHFKLKGFDKPDSGATDIEVTVLKFELFSINSEKRKNHLNLDLDLNKRLKTTDRYNLSWKNFSNGNNNGIGENGSLIISTTIRGLFPGRNLSKLIKENKTFDEDKTFDAAINIFIAFKDLIEETFNRFRYIGPLRAAPNYDYELYNSANIDITGKLAPSIYHNEKAQRIELKPYFNSDLDSFQKVENIENRTIQRELIFWFSIMGVKNFKIEHKEGKLIIYLSPNISSVENLKVRIPQSGFGVSQVFPILLEALRTNPGETLIIEQPEAHLNPKLQTDIADLFLFLALNNRRFIIETHSEHLIYRLLKRFAEDGITKQKSDDSGEIIKKYFDKYELNVKDVIAMYFVDLNNFDIQEDNRIRKVSLGENGLIDDWPAGFYDQGLYDKEDIVEALQIKEDYKQ